jgi:hypothetical protein
MSINPVIVEIESQIFTPALQKAMDEAKNKGFEFNDVIMGAANAYINMLVELLSKEKAQSMLENQANFLKSQ